MTTDALGTYLADHYAGSVSAAELVTRLLGCDVDPTLMEALRQVRESIERHQGILRELLAKRGSHVEHSKNLAAWLAEKVSRPVMPVDADDGLGLLRALEMLLMGMRGRVALWQTVDTILPSHPELGGFDADGLCREAEEQLRMMDRKRLEVARIALRGWTATGEHNDHQGA